MKKILVLIIMVLSFSLVSCNSNKNYEFITKEDVISYLDHYFVNVTMNTADGRSLIFVMCENEKYYYYEYNDNTYLIDKINDKFYSINKEEKVKVLESNLDLDYDANFEIVVDLLIDHIDVIDKNFKVSENSILVNGYECNEYYKNTKLDNNNYINKTYFIDIEKGFCIKSTTEICSKGVTATSVIEFNELKFDKEFIESYLNSFDDYNVEIGPINFKEWPTLGLGTMIPTCNTGKFMFAVDYGTNATISIEQIDLFDVKEYVKTFVVNGFSEGKSKTNEANQFIYITYNEELLMVKLLFTPSVSNLTIEIIQSTQEDINKELGKF